MRTLHAFVLLSLFLLVGYATDVPKDKETIQIDHVKGEGDKGSVEFKHSMHTTKAKNAKGEALSCVDCHHTAKPDAKAEDIKACTECHLGIGQEAKVVDGKKSPALAELKSSGKIDKKSVIYHTLCVDCHKAVKKNSEGKSIKSCKVCHTKSDDDE